MANIVLFDDDQHSLATLHRLVEQELPADTPCTLMEASDLEALEAILASNTQIDVLITDIMMPEGQPSGIEVVKRLFPPESGTQVIYVSGYLEQAPEVYQTAHVYFVLKPIDPAKLHDALERALSMLVRRQQPMLRVKTGHRDQLINISTILYLESSLHKVVIHCRNRRVETYARLDDLQTQLPPSFTRCHRSYLVNLAYVSSLGSDELRLSDSTTIPVSRRRSHQTQKDMLAYLSSRARAKS